MTNISKYDVVIVKFPFASSFKYKARPAVVISSNIYNKNTRDTLFIMAISSSMSNKLDFEIDVQCWNEAGLLKPSLFKSSVATIEKDFIITKVGTLSNPDRNSLDKMIKILC